MKPLLGVRGFLEGTSAHREAKKLRKEFPNFDNDMLEVMNAIAENPEEPPSDRIPVGDSSRKIYKRRCICSDSTKGKRGGYRIVYAIFERGIVVLSVYNKHDASNVPNKELLKAARETEQILEASAAAEAAAEKPAEKPATESQRPPPLPAEPVLAGKDE